VALDHIRAISSGHPNIDQWDGLLNEIAPQFGVPPNLAKAHIEYESDGDPNVVGSSGRGLGLMQIDYGTLKSPSGWVYVSQHGVCTTPFDPAINIKIGCRDFIAPNIAAFGDNLEAIVAAYNAGISAVQRAIERGSPMRTVTTDPNYVANVGTAYLWFCSQAHKALDK